MMKPLPLILGLTLAQALLIAAGPVDGAEKADVPAKVFEMREASAFEVTDWLPAVRGQRAVCASGPAAAVRKYPPVKSARPLYGSIRFDTNWDDPKAGIEYHFVLDESGQVLPDAPRARRYDRLHFDLNNDLDLTNDPAVGLLKNPPAGGFFVADGADRLLRIPDSAAGPWRASGVAAVSSAPFALFLR